MVKDFCKKNTKIPSSGILGNCVSAVFTGVEPHPNTPNRKITKFDVSKTNTEETSEIEELRKLLDDSFNENSALKEELEQMKARNRKLENEFAKLRDSKSGEEIDSKSGEESVKAYFDFIDEEILDKLKKVKLLGRGDTSEVFDVVIEKHFALKVFLTEFAREEGDGSEEEERIVINIEKMRRFVREYEVLNQLNHKSIVKMFGISFGDENHLLSILFEYCKSSLKKMIKRLNDEERISSIVDISNAMKEVHAVGIIHRDLKLENILVDENNKIKVSDFGLSTLITPDSVTMSRTQLTDILKYMTPELAQERKDYNEKVDVYAFGVVVFGILTKGELPIK